MRSEPRNLLYEHFDSASHVECCSKYLACTSTLLSTDYVSLFSSDLVSFRPLKTENSSYHGNAKSSLKLATGIRKRMKCRYLTMLTIYLFVPPFCTRQFDIWEEQNNSRQTNHYLFPEANIWVSRVCEGKSWSFSPYRGLRASNGVKFWNAEKYTIKG